MAAVRLSATGTELPSARLLSSKLPGFSNPQTRNTLFVMQWGQFIDHDIALTRVQTFSTYCVTIFDAKCSNEVLCSNVSLILIKGNGTGIQCCSKPQLGRLLVPPPSPECLAIEVPSYDPAYGNPQISNDLNINCMSFVRSEYDQPVSNGPRQQVGYRIKYHDNV